MKRPNSAQRWHAVRHLLGVPEHPTSWHDRLVATVISALGISIVVVVCQATRPDDSAASLWLVGSIGATAVLVFAVPHGPLSQPWAVICGQGISGLVGVTVAHLLGGGTVAKAVAVGGAIGAMHVCRCIHPPGGATSLGAVLMVTPGHDPSWLYPLTPAALNGVVIVAAAVLLNLPFAWRRYPLALAFPLRRQPELPAAAHPFTAEQLGIALRQLDTVVTISDEELQVIYVSLRLQQEGQSAYTSSMAAPRLRITCRSGSVHATASIGAELNVTGGELVAELDGWQSLDGRSQRIDVVCPVGTDLVIGTGSGSVVLRGRLGDVRVMTGSGTIRVEHAESADLRTSSAEVRVGDCSTECRVVTESGSVRVDAAARVEVSTMSGSIVVGRSDHGEIQTVSGSVDIGTSRTGAIRIRTMSSSVDVRVPAGTRPSTALSTGSKQIRNSCIDGSDGSIEVHSESGAIRISDR